MRLQITCSFTMILHYLLFHWLLNGSLLLHLLSKRKLIRKVSIALDPPCELTLCIGNFAIVGSFLPEIEIWDLDVLDVIEPTMVLGKEFIVGFIFNLTVGGTQEVTTKSKKGVKSFKTKTVSFNCSNP